ncbi:tyrosinase family oxidase copper chaperone [Streptomyces sp. NBC_00347]|uniref:apotyrosinase chaperone MelC1 n=1 Tax=Streptomyces sp. NBC_00347 TaxID=2975721 RepID=UPI00224D6F61|nr:tyrosinase family oxidase copper chaperone [Streptomyces sp. NBC_00347]MCX5126804.1 tyrosinase cofactor [Streptomyces sp. NBC_00347]
MPEDSTELTRRRMLLGTGGTLAAAGLAVLGLAGPAAEPARATEATDAETDFDETYHGRRIRGTSAAGDQLLSARRKPHAARHQNHGSQTILIDGQELHAMRNADGTWISVIHHYQTFGSPRALARAAVIELQGASLLPLG